MPTISENSDAALLDILRRSGPSTVSEMAAHMQVTQNAVRQRLNRLMGQQLVKRAVDRPDDGNSSRGRPHHLYSLTEKARREAGDNFADLALTLWREIRSVQDENVRQGLLGRIAEKMAARYAESISGGTTGERMDSLSQLFVERNVPMKAEIQPGENGELPVLTVEDCPYPQLAEQDRGICAVEKMMFSKLLDKNVKLTTCRLDGASCCEFVGS